jgi:transcription initiation factor IIE alpha subunit
MTSRKRSLRKRYSETADRPDLQKAIVAELAAKEKTERETAWAARIADEERKLSEEADIKRKKEMMVCPKCCREVSLAQVMERHYDYDDRWFTRYFYNCWACGSDIVDGFGQLIDRVEQN